MDTEFTRGPARRPSTVVEGPTLQWATGLPTANRQIYSGWLIEAGILDDLDGALQSAGFSQITIKHGSGKLVTHTAIETANVFVLADGVQSMAEMKRTNDRYGVAFGWRTLEGGRQQSVLKARVMLHELLAVGYTDPLILSVKSTLTGDVLAALTRQYEVLDAVDAFRALDNKPAMHAPFYAASIPLGPGKEVARGSNGQTKEITPPIANIPAPVTKDYIKAHWIKRDWAAIIEPMIDETIAWSVTTSQAIAAGTDARPACEDAAA